MFSIEFASTVDKHSRLRSLIDNETWEENSRQFLHTRDPQITVFLERQQHIATEYAGVIDPLDVSEYPSPA